MSTILMHIGTPKTATTTLQRILADLEKPLGERGILYPRAGRHGETRASHHRLAWGLTGKKGADESGWTELRSELETVRPRLAVVSCEAFAAFDDSLVSRIAGHLEGYEVRVVVYLRNQLDFMLSLYKQLVKSRNWKYRHSLRRFIDENLHRCDYGGMLDRWAGAFGSESVEFRLFDKIKRRTQVERDFFSAIGAEDLIGDAAETESSRRENVSPSDDSTRRLRLLNLAEPMVPDVNLKKRLFGIARRKLIKGDSRYARISGFVAHRLCAPLSTPSDIDLLRERTGEMNARFLPRISDSHDRELFAF